MGPHRHFLAMENVHIAMAVLVTAVATAGIAWYFGREQRGRRAIGAAPIVKVRDVKPGMTVRVQGVVAAREKGDQGAGAVLRATPRAPVSIWVRA